MPHDDLVRVTHKGKRMRKLYFVSTNGFDWQNMDTGDLRYARIKATEMYPQGIYGSICIGVLDGTDSVRKILVRSPKINEHRVRWQTWYSPNDERVVNRSRVWGGTWWLSIDGSDKLFLTATNIKAAKRIGDISPLLHPGSEVRVFYQLKDSTDFTLYAWGKCGSDCRISWQQISPESVTQLDK